MADLPDRLSTWLDLIRCMVVEPTHEFPHELLLDALSETFGCRAASNWVSPGVGFGFIMNDPPKDWPPEDALELWAAEAMWEHPLVSWFLTTRDPAAMSLGRVPIQFGSRRSRAMIRDLAPVELDQQLSIPFANSATTHRSIVLARTREDFSDEDLAMARCLQPLLMLLERHVSVVREVAHSGSNLPITGRELAVLVLLGQGMTAAGIAHRLGMSTRTVHKHLEHLYRKLGVNDRLLAVQVAHGLGLLEPRGQDDATGHPRRPERTRARCVHVRIDRRLQVAAP